MKKLLLLTCVVCVNAVHAQLEKGNKLAGLQFNLSDGDIYHSSPEFSFGNGRYRYGMNIIPTYGIAIERNWILGAQATLGYSKGKTDFGGTLAYDTYRELGIGPFTRLYLDISRNGKIKLYGMGSLELSSTRERFWNTVNGNTTFESVYSEKRLDATLGFGLGYFGNKLSVDLNISNLGLRLGFYFPSVNKKK